MKKFISSLLILAMLIPGLSAWAADNGSISITVDKSSAQVGDIIEATITLENMEAAIITLPVYFNPAVVKVVNSSGAVVKSGLKTAAEVRNGSAGIIPGQALSSDVDANDDPIYWNGAVFENPYYPYLDNENGLYKMMFTNAATKEIVHETLITIRFAVVGAGDTEIRFATQNDRAYDPTVVGGATYFGDGDDPVYPEVSGTVITATEGGTPPPVDPGDNTTSGGGLSPTITVNPGGSSSGGGLVYEVPEKLLENSIARAADETGNSMNVKVEAGSAVTSFVIKVPVKSVRKAYEATVLTMLFDTPIGIIGFQTAPVLARATDSSQFVVLTLKNNLECSIAIDGTAIQGCILGFQTENGGATAFYGGTAIMRSRFDGQNLLFAASQNGIYTMQTKEIGFSDLAGSHWAYGYIQSLVAKNVLAGMGDNSFQPESNVTREQFAKMIVSALEIYDETATCNFPDLPTSHWAYRYVASAVKAGIINGYDDGTFGVGRNITRQEVAVMVSRSGMSFAPVVSLVSFTDASAIDTWARDAVVKMQLSNIIAGFDDGSFRPHNNATRAQAAKIIYSILGLSII